MDTGIVSSLLLSAVVDILKIDPTIFAILMSSVIGPVVLFALSEFRLQRQRRWDREDRHRVANKQQQDMERLHIAMLDTQKQAQHAYTEANGVNQWRGKLTADMHRNSNEVLSLVRDTNQKVTEASPKIVLVPSASGVHTITVEQKDC